MTKKNVKPKKEWLDTKGQILEDKYLKLVAQHWGIDIWDKYLFETVEVPQREMVTRSQRVYENYADTTDLEELIQDVAEGGSEVLGNDAFEKELRKAMSELTDNQEHVIYLTFWKNRRNKEIADYIGTTPESVRRLKIRALETLKRKLSQKKEEYKKWKQS